METVKELFASQAFVLAFVLGTYTFSLWLFRKTKISLLHPLLTSIFLIIVVLKLFDVEYQTFEQGSSIVDFMLGPTVVALGVTLYDQVTHIKGNLLSILTSIFVGAIVGIASVTVVLYAMGANEALVATLQPKSVTTPIAMSISEKFGGLPSLTAVVVVAVGIFGGIVGPFVLDKLGVSSKIARGLALGAAAHGMGTARAMELGAIEGAISGLAIGLMGAATALLVPLMRMIM
ncbi:LrgB family protein [Acetobacteroides hydrogenigenes]|uniref:Putative murein hydrolase (TIGR00659 family) n=1 Tax=Acetobacteroides hydrogenigenes TaxID=979970 RepID=A0A4R2EAA2_9BACT|nr:LrgB family protein [Acetobacteroides hydrogenigenes]TCN65638.1 putative murein hydrolase (TIGR00659 family) [Acetobacteroides hydrogenigenes]